MHVILIVLCCILFIALIIFGMIYQRKMRLKRQEQHLKGEPKEALLYALSRMDALCEAENLEKISTAADAAALQEFDAGGQEASQDEQQHSHACRLVHIKGKFRIFCRNSPLAIMPTEQSCAMRRHSCIVIWHQMRQRVRAALNVCGIAMEDASAKTN